MRSIAKAEVSASFESTVPFNNLIKIIRFYEREISYQKARSYLFSYLSDNALMSLLKSSCDCMTLFVLLSMSPYASMALHLSSPIPARFVLL